ncbi:hypothetical protein BDV25DRAFT_165149 [Aspergillus avenaceus]|uniref:Uncharacterized protein n=1 Tax=Aspergillus avenaceus TaxID=36643 RepID=A0A5N6TFR8_ASPAV|nr:hypothetical protein BDV25DRAFT_165149 [Aspergillus avenaceus]
MSFGVRRQINLSIRSRSSFTLTQPARSTPRPHYFRQQQQHHPYSSTPPNSSSPYNRSQFKIAPFIAIFALGSGSYALLVKSRTGIHKPKADSQSPDS